MRRRTLNADEGNEVFKVAVNTLSRGHERDPDANGLQKEDIDRLVPHRPTQIHRMNGQKIEADRMIVITVHKHANTSSASVPLALDRPPAMVVA